MTVQRKVKVMKSRKKNPELVVGDKVKLTRKADKEFRVKRKVVVGEIVEMFPLKEGPYAGQEGLRVVLVKDNKGERWKFLEDNTEGYLYGPGGVYWKLEHVTKKRKKNPERQANIFGIDDPVLSTAAGAGAGALAGVLPGVIAGSVGTAALGGAVGGALGGYVGAPRDRKSRGAWGGGIGGGIAGPLGAVAGGAIGGRKASKKGQNPVRQLKNKLLK